MKKLISYILFPSLMFSLSACSEETVQTEKNETPEQVDKIKQIEEIQQTLVKPEIAETTPQDNQQASENNEPKSAEQLWLESQQLSKEVWNKSKQTTDQLWQTGKENSQEIWIDTKQTSSEVWNDVKDTSKEIWLDSNKAFETLLKTKEQEATPNKKTDEAAKLADDQA
ncbi:MAG: hypothetical protein WBM99_03880 [Psychromonas sp.]